MSTYMDLIATVDIDIKNPAVENSTFANVLLVGALPQVAPAVAPTPVGYYTTLDEILEAGWTVSEPIGAAAQIAFSQNPKPSMVYIAPIQLTDAAEASVTAVEEIGDIAGSTIGQNPDITACTVAFDADDRTLVVKMTDAASKVKNTNLFVCLSQIKEAGYTAKIGGTEIAGVTAFKATEQFQAIAGLSRGDDPVQFVINFSNDAGASVDYGIVVAYPKASDTSEIVYSGDELTDGTDETEDVLTTIDRALEYGGWYALCPVGVDKAEYESIAALIESEEKMFCYTEFDLFANEDNALTVSSDYFRTFAIYGRETTDQADEDIPAANQYLHVALACKWMTYDPGTETAAFKPLYGVYPSKFSDSELTILEKKNVNYFVTVGSRNISMNSKVVGGEWADIIRFRDWLKNDMQTKVANLFIVNPKIPYTDAGITLVQNQMLASLKLGQDIGGIAEDEFDVDGNTIPGYTTSVPRVANIPATVRQTRKLYDCKFTARLTGAIHFVEIQGTLSYEI